MAREAAAERVVLPERAQPTTELLVCSPWEAVNEAERRLCGAGLAADPVVAEGIALAGRPAATRLEPAAPGGSPEGIVGRGPWIHHALGCRVDPRFAVVLAAGNAQQAVDHCLAGHRIAAALGRPVLALLADAGLGRWESVRMPPELDGLGPAPASDSAVSAVSEALDGVSLLLGRRLAPYVWDGPEDATQVLLCCGSDPRVARAAALLREAGLRSAALGVALVEPLPRRELAARLERREVVFVEPPAASANGLHRWLALPGVRGSVPCGDPRSIARAAAQRFGAPEIRFEETPRAAGQALRVGVAAPVSSWAERVLRLLARELARVQAFEFDYFPAAGGRLATLAVRSAEVEAAHAAPLDAVLVAGDLALLRVAAAELREGGSLVVLADAGVGRDDLAANLHSRLSDAVRARGCVAYWVRPSDHGARPQEEARCAARIVGALLASHPSFAGALGADSSEPFTALIAESPLADALREGAEALEPLAPPEAAAAAPAAQPSPPALSRDAGQRAGEWEVPLRLWHLTGEGAAWDAEPCQASALRPALMSALEDPRGRWLNYPLLFQEGRAPEPLAAALARELDAFGDAGEGGAILREHLWRLCHAVESLVLGEKEASASAQLSRLLPRAFEVFLGGLDLSAAAEGKVRDVLRRLAASLPASSRVLPLGRDAALAAYATLARDTVAARRREFAARVSRLLHRVEDLLRTPAARAAELRSPEAIARQLGAPGSAWLDPRVLSGRLPERGVRPMPAARRARMLDACETLRSFLEAHSAWPCVLFVARDGGLQGLPPGCVWLTHADPVRAAAGVFDGHAEAWGRVLRAARIAELEVAGRFEGAVHGPVLAPFGGPFFSRDEMALLPRVAVVAQAQEWIEGGLDALSALLRSGRPVQVLALEPVLGRAPRPSWEALASCDPGLGYLAVAHREAFVLSTGLDDVEGLVQGLGRLVAATCPAVAVVFEPRQATPLAQWRELSAAHRGRAAVYFLYDPQAGESWAERFALERNPEIERPWPTGSIPYSEADGSERVLEEAFTFAHAVALDPEFRPHFRVIPVEAWSERQVPLAEYLDAPREVRRNRVPYIWVLDGEGRLARAVVSRALAWATLDRGRAWKVFQELAGTDNAYAKRAAERARAETLAQAELERRALEERHARELAQVRERAAEEAAERLLQALWSTELPPASATPAPGVAPVAPVEVPPAAAQAPPAEPAAGAEAIEEILLAVPYIDSALCTSCDDCIHINARMFRYNENKQATIADPTAGTFEELVRAAEKCPARCIHPGAPRPDDPTVTPELIERAKKFA